MSHIGFTRETSSLETAFTEMRGQFVTTEDYCAKGLGIDRAGQQALRERFIERRRRRRS